MTPRPQTCRYCLEHLAARSQEQLQRRIDNINSSPLVRVSPCPQCGGDAWVTTDVMVKNPKRRSWWKRLIDG